MKVSLGEFGSAAIADDARSGLAHGVEAALIHYVGQLETGRAALRLPRFRRRAPATEPAVKVELDLDAKLVAALEGESRRQQVALDRLLDHAVLVYVADCGSRRVVDQPIASGWCPASAAWSRRRELSPPRSA